MSTTRNPSLGFIDGFLGRKSSNDQHQLILVDLGEAQYFAFFMEKKTRSLKLISKMSSSMNLDQKESNIEKSKF